MDKFKTIFGTPWLSALAFIIAICVTVVPMQQYGVAPTVYKSVALGLAVAGAVAIFVVYKLNKTK